MKYQCLVSPIKTFDHQTVFFFHTCLVWAPEDFPQKLITLKSPKIFNALRLLPMTSENVPFPEGKKWNIFLFHLLNSIPTGILGSKIGIRQRNCQPTTCHVVSLIGVNSDKA